MRPPRHLLTTIEVVSIPLRQSIAGARAREAHGVQPKSRHDPSSRGARDLAKTRFNKVFAIALQARFPGAGKGLIKFICATALHVRAFHMVLRAERSIHHTVALYRRSAQLMDGCPTTGGVR
jgi:hypothetical protein